MLTGQMDGHSILDAMELHSSGALDSNEPPRKLAVLGLPWDTRYAAVQYVTHPPHHVPHGRTCSLTSALPRCLQ